MQTQNTLQAMRLRLHMATFYTTTLSNFSLCFLIGSYLCLVHTQLCDRQLTENFTAYILHLTPWLI